MLTQVKSKPALSWTNTLRQLRLRATSDRLLVLSAMEKISRPLSIQQLHNALGRNKVNQVTLYRILKQLTKLGLLRQLNFHQAHALYELQTDHHHHVICQSCGLVKAVRIDDAKLVYGAIRQTAYKISQHNLEFFGLCLNCQ